MAKSIVSQVATKMVEINSRLGGLAGTPYQLSIKTAKKKDTVILHRMEMQSNFDEPKFKAMKTFPNYNTLYEYIVPFCDGLDFAGLAVVK